jgi:type IV pilus assembly protein PilM
MAKARVAWGIDIGNRALKAVKVVRAGEGVRIDEVEVIEHENILSNAGDNREQLIQTALALFTSKHSLKGNPAAIGVSGQQSFARFIKLPPVEEKKIPEIVRFEAIQQIPFPLDEVEWSYHLFKDEASPDVEVGLFAMRKELVNQHLAYFGGTGVNIQAVQMNPLAVYNALSYDQRFKGATMVIDLGAENADLIIAEGETVWMRSIPIGGNHFTEALVRDFKLRFERAEELKRTTATSPHGRRILQAMRPVFADLVSEIQRSIGFYSSTHRDSRIARVIALGGTFKLPGLQKYLQQNLGLDVVKLEGLGQEVPADSKIAAALSENLLSCAGAYGLALQAMGEAKITSSLLPAAIQKERVWKQKIPYFAAAAACFVVGTGIAYFSLTGDRSAFASKSSERSQISKTINDAKRRSTEWKQQVEAGGDGPKRTIAEVKSLTDYRNLWATLMAPPDNRVGASFPLPFALGWTPPANLAAAPKAGPVVEPTTRPAGQRGARTDITLDQMQVMYFPRAADMLQRIKLTDGAEIPRDASSVFASFVAAAGGNMGVGTPGVGPGVIAPGVMPGAMPPGGVPMDTGPLAAPGVLAPGGGTDQAAPADASKRGFYVTLYLTTPNSKARELVRSNIVDTLLRSEAERTALAKRLKDEKKLTSAELQRRFPFRIAAAQVYRDIRLDQDQFLQQQIQARARQAARRKSGGGSLLTPGGAGGMPGGLMPGGMAPGGLAPGGVGVAGTPGATSVWPPAPPPPGAIIDPNATNLQPGAIHGTMLTPAAEAAEADRLLRDPVTGESIKLDYTVIVNIAIELDPWYEPPAPPPQEGSGDPSEDPNAVPPST